MQSDSSRSRAAARAKRAAAVVAAMIVLYSVGSWWVYYFVSKGHTETVGPRVVQWVNSNLPHDAKVMGISLWGLGLNVDYYSREVHCGDYSLAHSSCIRKLGIRYVLFDDREWGYWSKFRRHDNQGYLRRHCKLVNRIGDVGVWDCKR